MSPAADLTTRRLPRAAGRFLSGAGWATGALAAVAFVAATLLAHTSLFATFAVLSASMEPTIPVGSLVVVVPVDPSELGVGDVISFTSRQPPYPTLTHRTESIRFTPDGPVFQTRGDANEAADPWEVQYSGMAGKVAFYVPLAGHAVMAATTPAVRWLLGALLVGLLAGFWLTRSRPRPSDRIQVRPVRGTEKGLPHA